MKMSKIYTAMSIGLLSLRLTLKFGKLQAGRFGALKKQNLE
jgi:hypothetical protein